MGARKGDSTAIICKGMLFSTDSFLRGVDGGLLTPFLTLSVTLMVIIVSISTTDPGSASGWLIQIRSNCGVFSVYLSRRWSHG